MSKIIGLQVENVKRVSAVEIIPKENMIVIGGKNAQGKTSCLDAITMALGGGNEIPDGVLKKGAKKGFVKIDLGDVIVTRTFTASGTTSLVVTNAEGAKYNSPQSILDALLGKLTFDPLKFMGMDGKKQAELLMEIAGLSFADKDAERKEVYDERTAVNRELVSLEARLVAAPRYPGEPKELVSVEELNNQLAIAADTNTSIARLRSDIAAKKEQGIQLKATRAQRAERVAKLREELSSELLLLDADDNTLEEFREQLQEMLDLAKDQTEINTTEVLEKIKAAEEINLKIQANLDHAEIEKQASAKMDDSEALTARISAIDEAKNTAITGAQMPVDGLAFSPEGEVTFNGVALAQASGAEQLRVSVAIGSAINPKLRVMLCREGAVLDDDSLALLGKFAEEKDIQVWVESCHAGELATVTIVNGEVEE